MTLDEQSEKNYLDISLYDYFKFCREKNADYRLAIVITDKQKVINIVKGFNNEHWLMVGDIFEDIFPGKGYNFNNPYNDAICLFSTGDYLAMDLPEIVSDNQLKCLGELLYDAKRFEYDYETCIHFVGKIDELSSPEGFYFEAKERYSPSANERNTEGELIIGEPIDGKKGTINKT